MLLGTCCDLALCRCAVPAHPGHVHANQSLQKFNCYIYNCRLSSNLYGCIQTRTRMAQYLRCYPKDSTGATGARSSCRTRMTQTTCSKYSLQDSSLTDCSQYFCRRMAECRAAVPMQEQPTVMTRHTPRRDRWLLVLVAQHSTLSLAQMGTLLTLPTTPLDRLARTAMYAFHTSV
jgi:hypothetical protein